MSYEAIDVRAKMTSRGRITIPKAVRYALDLREGDELLFHVEDSRAVVAKTPEFIAMAGSVSVSAVQRGTPWDEVLRETRRLRTNRAS
jgi:AbrB family looped-hinge helix DNA binding protein